METKVTLRKFLEIAPHIISPWICEVQIEEYMADYGDVMRRPIKFSDGDDYGGDYLLRDIKNLDPYLDYEIYGFDQEYCWGELDRQIIWIR